MYPSNWQLQQRSATAADFCLDCEDGGSDGNLRIVARRGNDFHSLYDAQIARLQSRFNLAPNEDPARTVIGPQVGHVLGIGRDYCGDSSSWGRRRSTRSRWRRHTAA